MKPIRLVMRAVGPFPVEQVVDFRRLQDRSLFLVHGPTGSGKTTILDALCYALYGVCSGDDRDPNRIRSDYALPSTATEVTLDFGLGRDLYRVYRRPEQQGIGKRGNQAKIRADALLTKRTGIEDDSVEGGIVAVKPKEVTRAVEDLLGFKSDQFRQVVVLPQGEFRRFLASGSSDRKKILEVLFQTELYRRIEEALKAAAKEVADSTADARRQVSLILQNSGSETADELQQRQSLDRAKLDDILAKLDSLRKEDEVARERLNHGKLILERLSELRSASEALAALEQRVPAVSDKRATLDAARKAEAITGREEAVNKRIAEVDLALKKIRTAQKTLERTEAAKCEAEVDLKRESGRQPERDRLKQKLGQLDLLTEQVSELDTARKRLSLAEQGFAAREAELVAAAKAVEKAKSLLDDNQHRTSELDRTVARLELLRHQVQEADRNWKLGKELGRRRGELNIAEEQLRKVAVLLDQARHRAARAREEFKQLEANWIRGQAAILARDLAPGIPCPVCGSTEHPSPAISEVELPDEQVLKEKNAELEKQRSEADRIVEERLRLEKEVARLSEAVKSTADSLGERAVVTVAEFQRESKELGAELRKAEDAQIALASLRESATKNCETLERAQQENQEALDRKNAAFADRKAARADATVRLSGIPEDLRDVAALGRAKNETALSLKRLELAFEKAQQALSTADRAVAASQAALQAANEAASEADMQVRVARDEFTSGLTSAGFSDYATYLVSKKSKSETRRLQEEIEQFDQALAAARDRRARADKAAVGLESPDMKALEETASKSAADLAKAQEQRIGLAKEIDWRQKQVDELTLHAAELDALERKYAVLGRVSEVASGTNRERTTFQRFVLAALLDDVLRAASDRFLIMTNRRFSLQRVPAPVDRRMAAGLDLEVEDAYTGTCRPVASLSGGESFLAALSLALGLADVVQAYSGGIRLDTIFVDEGFGNLDSDALDLAFRALIDLQRSGRLVGIISHVSELQERIDTRLEVMPAKVGSIAKFVFG